jgi:hypothetical protein
MTSTRHQRLTLPKSASLICHRFRAIPPPDDLLGEVKKVVSLRANVRDAKTDDSFFSRETWKACHAFVVHIKKGCVSDKPGFNHCCCSAADGEKSTLHCIQGTSKLEGFHKHSRQILATMHSSPLLALRLLAVFVHQWNHDRVVECGLTQEEFEGACCHDVVHDVQAMCIDDEKRTCPGFQHVNDHASAEERFYTPIVDRTRASKLDNKIPCDDSLICKMLMCLNLSVLLLQERLRAAVTMMKRMKNRKFRSRQSGPMKSRSLKARCQSFRNKRQTSINTHHMTFRPWQCNGMNWLLQIDTSHKCNVHTQMAVRSRALQTAKGSIFSVPGGAPGGGTIKDAQVGFLSGQSEQIWFSGRNIKALSRFFNPF